MTWQHIPTDRMDTDDGLSSLGVPIALGAMAGVLVGVLGFAVVAVVAMASYPAGYVTTSAVIMVTISGTLLSFLAALLAGTLAGRRARRRPVSPIAVGRAGAVAAAAALTILLLAGLLPRLTWVTAFGYLLSGAVGGLLAVRMTGGSLRRPAAPSV